MRVRKVAHHEDILLQRLGESETGVQYSCSFGIHWYKWCYRPSVAYSTLVLLICATWDWLVMGALRKYEKAREIQLLLSAEV